MYHKLEEILNQSLNQLNYNLKSKVSKSNIDNIDFQCDDAFKLAKLYHKAPMQIAQEIADEIKKLSNFNDYFKTITISKPGFININVSDQFINESLRTLMKSDKFGITEENQTIILDYGGPNVAKPLHVGHLRAAVIGQALNNILKFKGNKTIGDVHLGDIGLQMGQVIYGILNDFPDTKAEDINFDLNYLNVTYPKISALCKVDPLVKEKCALITKELQEGNKEYQILWNKIRKISITDIKRIYDYLDVHFDLWYGESDAYKYLDEMTKYMEQEGIITLDDGAKIIDIKEKEDKVTMPPCILQKSDGAYLYSSSDLATIWQREKDFHPDDIIYVVDGRQSMYFTQIFRAVKKSHIYDGNLEHHGFGTVNGEDNKPFKTRDGGALKLEDLIKQVRQEFINLRPENQNMQPEDLDKIVNAIIKFTDLQNDLTRNYIFDIKKFCEVNGKTGPYILYTYLRINKLLTQENGEMSNLIYNETDRNLRLKLLDVTFVIELSAKERRPHYIANYLYELSSIANNFYQENRFTDLDSKTKTDYNILLTFNNKTINILLSLLGIHIPTAM
jgi:arginyl-tRNA synthetase